MNTNSKDTVKLDLWDAAYYSLCVDEQMWKVNFGMMQEFGVLV